MASQSAGPVSGAAPVDAVRRGLAVRRGAVCFGLVVLLCLTGAGAGIWYMPFALGVAAGAGWPRSRPAVLVVAVGAVAGWALALWIMALHSLPVGATARTIAALAGLPPYAAIMVAVTLLLAALQALAGTWLARAVLPHQLRLPFRRRRPAQPGDAAPAADPQP